MMNYVMKKGDTTKTFSLESEQTAGSYNFFNSYNAVGGKVGKVSYYAYYDNRHGDGWRPNAAFNYHAYYANINYQFSKKGSLSFQFSRMDYVQQIAGGQTDAQFQANAQQSNRARNYFNPIINVPALIFNYKFSSRTQLEITSHWLFGERSSVQFINTPNIADTINTSIGSYNPRQVDRDFYNAFTTEARLLHRYQIGSVRSTMAGGLRYFTELTNRRQKGVGTIGSDFDLTLVKPYGIDLNLHTNNYALFVENLFELTPKFSATPGFRYEVINTLMDGVINNATFPVSYKSNRSFPLFGIGLQYQANEFSQLYGNISQAYRPFLYANVTPATQLGLIDPNLKDSKGYDIDMGYRGSYKNIVRFDINAFYLYYGDRIGQLNLNGANNTTYLYTTNIGNAVAKGVEAYVNVSLWKLMEGSNQNVDIRIFNSTSYNHARYTSGAMNYNGENKDLNGNHLEGVPDWINRTGLELRYKGILTTLQTSSVSENYSDANNTAFNPTGATGIVPSYRVWDWSFSWNFMKIYHLSSGVNNLTNLMYFTRRINMYPGPGILPADGRTFYLSLGIKI
jgi:Fe(3+) dicitrate transport protein